MPVEIERKFLVNKERWNLVEKPKINRIKQGYLLTDPNKTIRVRLKNTKGYITIKGLSVGATRQEFEYEIPRKDAEQLLEKFSVSNLEKNRYEILYKGKLWEVDEFLGDNSGLIIAEIELNNESEIFELPNWIEKEVTDNKQYYNVNIAKIKTKSPTT